MARLETWYKQDLKKPVLVHRMETVFNQDALGHLFGVEVYSDGEAVTLAGSVTGYCLLADGTTVPVAGTRSANKASIVIPQTAYSVIGPITITVKLTEGSAITTLLAVVGMVARSRTGQQVDPGQTITDWTNQIAQAMQDVEDASAVQDAKISDLKAALSDNNGNVIKSSDLTDTIKENEIRFANEAYKVRDVLNAAKRGKQIIVRDAKGNGEANIRYEMLPIVSGSNPSPSSPISVLPVSEVRLHRSTKNLLEITAVDNTVNGVTFTINRDGSIYINGTATARVEFVITNKIPFCSGAYTVTAFSGVTTSLGITFEAFKSDGTWDKALIGLTQNNPSGDFVFDTTTSAALNVKINITSGAQVDETIFPCVSLKTVEMISGKSDWFNYANLLADKEYQQFTAYGVTFSAIANRIHILGTSTTAQQYYYLTNHYCLAGTYTFKLDCSVVPNIGAVLNETDSNGAFIRTLGSLFLDGTARNTVTFTLTKDTYITGYLNIPASKVLDAVITPVLTEGFASNDTIKSNHVVYDFELPNQTYIGYFDTFSKTYINEGYAIILTGNENWSENTQAGYKRYTLNTGIAKNTQNPYAICSHFVENEWAANDSTFFVSSSGIIYIRYDGVANLDAFKAWLSNNSVTICYRKYYATTHDLSFDSKITLLRGVNIIWTEDGGSIDADYEATHDLLAITNAVQNQSYITPEFFGATGDGITDDTVPMQLAIQYCETNNTALYLSKNYLVTSELRTSGVSIMGNGRGKITLGNENACLYFDQIVPVPGDTSDLYIVQDFTIDCNNIASSGLISEGYRVRYTNINIVNVHQYGIKVIRGYENIFSGIHISATSSGTTGIYSTVGDNEFYDITMVDIQIAVNEHSNNGSSYARIHPWLYTPTLLNGSIFFKIDSWTCSLLTDCVCDTYQTAFWFANGTASNLQVKGLKHLMHSSITTQSGITSEPIYWIYYDAVPENPIYEARIKFSQCYAPDYIFLRGWIFKESNLQDQWAYYDNSCNLHFSDRVDCRNLRREIALTGVTPDKNIATIDGGLVTINIEGTPAQSILGNDARIIDLSDAASSILYPDGVYRIPVYYSTTGKFGLDGIAFGFLQTFGTGNAAQMLLNVKLPSDAKYMVINAVYHAKPSYYR